MYTLERVLKIKKDTVSHVVFLDEAMKVKSLPDSYQKPADSLLRLVSFLRTNLVLLSGQRWPVHWRRIRGMPPEVSIYSDDKDRL